MWSFLFIYWTTTTTTTPISTPTPTPTPMPTQYHFLFYSSHCPPPAITSPTLQIRTCMALSDWHLLSAFNVSDLRHSSSTIRACRAMAVACYFTTMLFQQAWHCSLMTSSLTIGLTVMDNFVHTAKFFSSICHNIFSRRWQGPVLLHCTYMGGLKTISMFGFDCDVS